MRVWFHAFEIVPAIAGGWHYFSREPVAEQPVKYRSRPSVTGFKLPQTAFELPFLTGFFAGL